MRTQICDVDGSTRKTATSKLLGLLNSEATRPTEKLRELVSLVNMGLIWRLATPTPKEREARKATDCTILATTWIKSARSSSHAYQTHASSASSMTSTAFPSASG